MAVLLLAGLGVTGALAMRAEPVAVTAPVKSLAPAVELAALAKAEAVATDDAPAVAPAAPTPVSVLVQTEPQGAEVVSNGKMLGVTPLEVAMRVDQEPMPITVSLGGHEPRHYELTAAEPTVALKLSKRRPTPPTVVQSARRRPLVEVPAGMDINTGR